MRPTVSIIIPVLNGAHCIGRAIESIQTQTLWKNQKTNYEVIVVDDRSTDNLPEVVSKIKAADPRVHLIKSNRPQGVSGARNTGIKTAKGDYIAFLDSDDIWRENKLQAQLDILKKSPHPQEDTLVLSYWVGRTKQGKFSIPTVLNFLANGDRDERGNFKNFRTFPQNILEKEVVCGGVCLAAGSTLFAHRSALRKNGPFNEKLWCGEDSEYLTRQILSGRHVQAAPDLHMIYAMPEDGKYKDVSDCARYMIKQYTAPVEKRFGEEAASRFRSRYKAFIDDNKENKTTRENPDRPRTALSRGQQMPSNPIAPK